MTGYDCICETINRFEKSLQSNHDKSELHSVSTLATISGYSLYHFTRLFGALVGMSPKEYIMGRILTCAAYQLREKAESISEIAQRFGFSEPEVFSRNMRRQFGMSPKQIRIQGIPANAALSSYTGAHTIDKNLVGPEPEIIQIVGYTLTGLPFYMEEGIHSFHRPWALFHKVQHLLKGKKHPEIYCQYSSWVNDESYEGLHILCAMETDESVEQEPLFYTKTIPPCTYLQFIHTGPIAHIHRTYEFIYKKWLASHEIKPSGCWECQRYRDNDSGIEICIPISIG